jgi:hypothetical protein
VKGDGFPFALDPGKSKFFTAAVKLEGADETPFCLTGQGRINEKGIGYSQTAAFDFNEGCLFR